MKYFTLWLQILAYFVAGVHRVWEYIDLKRRWRSADPSSVIALENAFVNGFGNVKILLSGTKFTADFDSNVVRGDDGLTEYKVSRNHFFSETSVIKRNTFSLIYHNFFVLIKKVYCFVDYNRSDQTSRMPNLRWQQNRFQASNVFEQ